MQRKQLSNLIMWKNKPNRKPLLLEGARQVGKTWLIKQFGKTEFESFVYINCDNNASLENVFIDYDVKRILRNLSALTDTEIQPGKTLVAFDEIQECPKALTALKYFCEEMPELHIVAAGSLLGLMDHYGTGFPVGKIESLMVYPLSFIEFLYAMGKDILVNQIKKHSWDELNALNPQLTELLRQYYFVGGMPEVVLNYVENQNLLRVREIQKQILSDYERDISKHASKNDIAKINMVWESIPSQLAKENKKFIYGAIKTGGRAKEFENAIQWLINAGLVYKVNKITTFQYPLKFYEDFGSFKLYVHDIGLLGAMSEAPAAEILVGNNCFSTYKGSFTEQYVLQQYISVFNGCPFYYANDNSTMEIDFVIQRNAIYPVEVKAEENLRAKSLSTVLKNNESLFGIRFSMADYREQERMVNVPLGVAEEYFLSMV